MSKHKHFRSSFGYNIFKNKYALTQAEEWNQRAYTIVESVCGADGIAGNPLMSEDDRKRLTKYITEFKFIPGGRYIYYAGRKARFYNNCYLLKGEEDTREEWGNLINRAMSCLTTGGGIGIDYSKFRPKGRLLSRTGGQASGPIPLMTTINEIGRNVMQGGSRRSAIYASLNWKHDDVHDFLASKNWKDQYIPATGLSYWDIKQADFNFPAVLDMTNISVNYDNAWRDGDRLNDVFMKNVEQALSTAEPGFSFNFDAKQNETLRNACVTGDTLILTRDGHIPIIDTIGKKVEVWNGEEWSEVEPYKTGTKQTFKVTLSDGRSLTCSDNHEWLLEDNTRVETKELEVGAVLEYFPIPNPIKRKLGTNVVVTDIQFGKVVDTYCFNEPKAHRGTFNGIVTGQCTEVTSEDDSDVCNLGSVNMANIANIEEMKDVVSLGAKFLVCGTIRAELPYEKIYHVRQKNRRIGLGLLGMHEWLLQRNKPYAVDADMRDWLQVYKDYSESAANEHCDRLFINRPVAYRAIAPTGTIGILAKVKTGPRLSN